MLKRKNKGLTLIEMIMTVAIIGIIASIAWSYFDKTQMRSRRVDAINGILAAQQFMEQCYNKVRNYNDASCNDLSVPGLNTSPRGYYTISLASVAQDSYELQATPVVGGLQDGDDCAVFSIKNSGDTSGSSHKYCWGR